MTALGNDRQLRKAGRYGRVMGTLWRHKKTAKCGFASMGLLLHIWSWCADQNETVVPETVLRKLAAGNPNTRRLVNELLSAGFLEAVEGGYAPHDWAHYTTSASQQVSSGDVGSVMEMRWKCDEDGDEDVMKPVSGIIEKTPAPRARALSQIPDPRSQEELKPSERVRVRESFAPPAERAERAAESGEGELASQVQRRFRRLHLEAFRIEPYMGGKNVGGFPAQLASTAAARQVEPLTLLETAFAAWAAAPRTEIGRGAPYAAFCARFGLLVDGGGGSPTSGPSDPRERLITAMREARSSGDGPGLAKLEAEWTRLFAVPEVQHARSA